MGGMRIGKALAEIGDRAITGKPYNQAYVNIWILTISIPSLRLKEQFSGVHSKIRESFWNTCVGWLST